MTRGHASLVLGCALSVGVTMAAATGNAAMMTYGTFVGDHVTFADVKEDSLEPELHYVINGTVDDTLLIDPKIFGVQQDPGPGSELIDSELEMTIIPDAGQSVNRIAFVDQGDYTIIGNGAVEASVTYAWRILEVNGQPIDPIDGNGMAAFSSTTNGTGLIWSVPFEIDTASELQKAGMTGLITKVDFGFDNSMTATADDELSIAFIKKKQIDGVQVAIGVPEPAGMALLLLGIVGTFESARRWGRSLRS